MRIHSDIITIALLAAITCCGCRPKSDARGEELKLIQSGENGNVSFGLYHAITHSRGEPLATCDLVLVLRDYGAKFVDLSKVTETDFSVQDSRGTNVTLTLCSSPESLTLGTATVIHLRLKPSAESLQPWRFAFKAKGSEYASALSITNIRW